MYKAGAIISIIAGIFGILAAVITLFFGGLGGAVGAEGAKSVVGFGWVGLLASMLVIVFAAVAFVKPKSAGIGLVICSIGGIIGGGTFVAICLVLSLIGGILCLAGAKSVPASATAPMQPVAESPATALTQQRPWSNGRMVLYGLASFFLPLIGAVAGVIGLTKEHTRKQGAILLGLTVAGILMYVAIGKNTKEGGLQSTTTVAEQTSANAPSKATDKYSELVTATPITAKPTGELAELFGLMSKNTDIQRENKLKELKGKVVEWKLTVYEVAKEGDGYKIQTGGDDEVGTFVYLSARNDSEKKQIETMKTDDSVFIKGVVSDTFLRNLVIKPAILFPPAQKNAAPAPAAPTQQSSATANSDDKEIALAYAKGQAQKGKCDFNEDSLEVTSGKVAGVEGNVVVTSYGLESCGGGNNWGSTLAVIAARNGKWEKIAEEVGPGFAEIRVVNDQISVKVTEYGPNDARCCPSISKTRLFVVQGNKLVQAQPVSATAPPPSVPNNPQAPTENKSHAVTPQPLTNPTMAVLAMIAAAKNQNNAAILSAKVTLDSFPKPDRGDRKLARAKNKLGLDAMKENAYESAIARLNEGVAADPSDVEVKNNLGYALMMAEKLDYAKKTLIESLALDSARGAAWANLGQTLAKQGDEESAVAAFVNTFIFSRAQNKTVEFLTNLSQSDPDPSVKSAAAKALSAPLIKGVAVINK